LGHNAAATLARLGPPLRLGPPTLRSPHFHPAGLLKVAIAIQRVKGRTAKFRNKGANAQAAPPECNWVDAGTRRYDAQHIKLPAPTAKYSAFLSHYKMEGLSLRVEPQNLCDSTH
jgi:hypothetical protein